MSRISREQIHEWIEENEQEAHVCPDCEGLHIASWESRDAVLEARCFVEKDRCSLLTEIAIRPSAVLPLQGALHFMNYDFAFLKVMISMSDNDVPRLLMTHAVPMAGLNVELFSAWFKQMLSDMDTVYKQLEEMEVLMPEDDVFMGDFDDQLH